MAPAYKLTYFDGRWTTEIIRYLFKYGNIEFEDVRIKHEDWPKFKEDTPFGQLPVLEHNGKKVNQTLAIARYVAKKAKLVGNDDWENLEIDAVVETLYDLKGKIQEAVMGSDDEKKKALKETLLKETFPYYFQRLDALAQKNNGYLAAGRLTWADFVLVVILSVSEMAGAGDIVNKYSNLKALNDKVTSLPAIKKWIEERPKTAF